MEKVYSRQDCICWYHWTIFVAEILASLLLFGLMYLLASYSDSLISDHVVLSRILCAAIVLPIIFVWIMFASSIRRLFWKIPVLPYNGE